MNFLAILFLMFIVIACSSVNKEVGLPDDNPFEQALEEVIRKETGVEIDFTPEDKKNVS